MDITKNEEFGDPEIGQEGQNGLGSQKYAEKYVKSLTWAIVCEFYG